MINIPIKRLAHGYELPLPKFATEHSAGCDVVAALEEDLLLEAGNFAMLPTGFAMAIPSGYEVQVRPRSGLAAKHGVTVLNSPGTIDADYRGEVKILLINHGKSSVTISRGMRIAQLVVAAVPTVQWSLTDALDATQRGSGGFGSTGVLPINANED